MAPGGMMCGSHSHQQGLRTRESIQQPAGMWQCLGASVLTSPSLLLPSATKELRERGRVGGTKMLMRRNAQGYHLLLVGKKSTAPGSRDGSSGVPRSSPSKGG